MHPRSVDALVLTLGTSNRYAVTTAQLEAVGLSRRQVASREGRLLTRVAPGIYAVGPITSEALTSAALLAVSGAALSHRTAAAMHGLPIRRRGATIIEVLAVARTRSVVPGVRFRSTLSLPDEDVVVVGGRRVTSVARTVCDLAASLSASRLRHLVESAVVHGSVTSVELQACLLSYCRRGRTGSALLRRLVLPELEGGAADSSELERMTVRLLQAEGLGGWTAQFAPPWFDGVRGVVDFAWPDQKVLLEVDGRRWHSVTQAFEADRRRDQLAIAEGWWPIRAGWQQVTQRPGELAAILRTALER